MARDGRLLRQGTGWDLKAIEAEKSAVKQELGDASLEQPAARLSHCLSKIRALADDESDRGRLQRYVFIMSALVHHERHGGLPQREIEHLVTLAYAILQTQGLKPTSSRLASLYGDLHLIKSQIYRKEGEPWLAAWEQQVALQLSGSAPSGGVGFQKLAMGNRALRLGHAALAIRHFEECDQAGVGATYAGLKAIGHAQALWLNGRGEEAADLRERAMTDLPLSDAVKRELTWGQLVAAFRATGDLAPLIAATRRGASHYQASYVIETRFWARTTQSRQWLERSPRLHSIGRNRTLKPGRTGTWYQAGLAVEDAYDYGIPLLIRLKAIGRALKERGGLLTVDKELLLWASVLRWLTRSKSSDLAALASGEYRALSLKLTDGRCVDALGIVGDIINRAN